MVNDDVKLLQVSLKHDILAVQLINYCWYHHIVYILKNAPTTAICGY